MGPVREFGKGLRAAPGEREITGLREWAVLGDGMWQGERGHRGVANQGTRGDR